MAKQRALVSVTEKRGLEEFRRLTEAGWELISTGGTAGKLQELGMPVTLVETVTGFPEMMDGRLKTLHPMVFGGILADRGKAKHMLAIAEHGIQPIDLVVVNLYDFVGKPDIEQIDIGGPSLLRAAAKNWESVVVVVNPDDYPMVVGRILLEDGVDRAMRHRLATRVFEHTSRYDAAVAAWMSRTASSARGRLRNDLPLLEISLTHFQDFDQGERVTQTLPREWGLRAGDMLKWTLADFDGLALVVSCEPEPGGNTACVLKKLR